jgi:hypothetical protein
VDLPGFLHAAYQFLDIKYPKFYKMDNLSKLGWLGTEVLLKESFDREKYLAEDIGVVLMNASSSLDADIKYFESTKEIASPALFVYTLPNIVIGEISIKHNFKGESAFFIFEQFDPGFLEQYVTNLFDNNIVQVCICGWVEVLADAYEAVLFLVGKERMSSDHDHRATSTDLTPGHLNFNKENLNKIYQR